MLWWSALTKQFGELATKAVQDSQAGLSQLSAAAPEAAGGSASPAKRKSAPAAAKRAVRKR